MTNEQPPRPLRARQPRSDAPSRAEPTPESVGAPATVTETTTTGSEAVEITAPAFVAPVTDAPVRVRYLDDRDVVHGHVTGDVVTVRTSVAREWVAEGRVEMVEEGA